MRETLRHLQACLLRALTPAALFGLLAACAKEGADLTDSLIETNREIAKTIDEFAEQTDLYVANDKYVDRPNKSSVTLHNDFSFHEGGQRVYSPRLGVKLHLPNLQEKLQLAFTSYDEDETDRGINENRYQTEPLETSYGTSLALFQQLGNIKTEFRPRLEFTDRLQTSHLMKFTSEAKRGTFSILPELQLFARSDTGTGQFVALNFAFDLGATDHLTVINEEQYTDGDNTLSTNHGLAWVHGYSDRMSHKNSLILESNNRSTYHLDRYVFSSSFRHKLVKDVVHYSATPYLIFPKIRAFRTTAAFDFRFEIIF